MTGTQQTQNSRWETWSLHDPTKKKGVSKKLSDHYLGPYKILEQTSPVLYKLDNMGQKSDIVHADRLKPYRSPSKHSIRNTVRTNKKEEQTEIDVEDTQDTEELIEQLQGFLRPAIRQAKK